MHLSKNHCFHFLGIVVTIIFLSSCSPKYVGYVTSKQNIPLLRDRNQGQIVGMLGFNHLEGQGSFSPLKHVALMGNLYAGKNGLSTEYGGGLYATTKSGFVFEAYALRINSKMRNHTTKTHKFISEHVSAEVEDLKARYDGYSAQFDIGYKITSEHSNMASFGIGIKYSQVHYDEFEYDQKFYSRWGESDQQLKEHNHITLQKSEVNFLSISPTARVGFKPVNLFLQFSTHISLDNYEASQTSFPLYSKNWISIGLELRLNDGSLDHREEKKEL